MRIVTDISVMIKMPYVTGIQRVTTEVLLRFIDQKEELLFIAHRISDNQFHVVDTDAFYQFYRFGKGSQDKLVTDAIFQIDEFCSTDTFFEVDGAWMYRIKRSWLLPKIKERGAFIVTFIHDCIPVLYPQYCRPDAVIGFLDYIGAQFEYADRLITSTVATKLSILKLMAQVGARSIPCAVAPFGSAISGVSEAVKNGNTDGIRTALVNAATSGKYLLMVGTVEPRKNQKFLLDAYDRVLKERKLNIILVGAIGWKTEKFVERLHSHPDFNKRIFHFENLDNKELDYAYSNAFLMIFPSYAEGFGLPLIEAIAKNVPVLASDIAVSREIAGDFCEYFELDNIISLCMLVDKHLSDEEYHRKVKWKLKEFRQGTWDTTAQLIKNEL